MSSSISDISPFVPSDKALQKSALPNKAMDLAMKSSRLTGQLSPITLTTLEQHMAVINSYYSNLIEGNRTLPHEIRAAQRGDYSIEPGKRDLQLESVAHMHVQQWMREKNPDLQTLFSTTFIRQLHYEFYAHIPESLWVIKDKNGKSVDKVAPGEWRKKRVEVGLHLPPAAENIADMMERFCEVYQSNNFSGDRKLIAIMAAHHRFEWIHPFVDGNGRVGRLLTDAALKAVGLDSYGVWCLSRGLARTSAQYKSLLAGADAPRQGNSDGRGLLTEKGLILFCDYMLDTAIDQISYMSTLLDMTNLRKRLENYVIARNDARVLGISGSLKSSAALVLYTAFLQGEITRTQALELCGMPERTARRFLSQLKIEALLSETSTKSPLRWEIPEHIESWYFPDLAPM